MNNLDDIKIKGCMIYTNSYRLIKLLNKEDQKEISLAMLDYMFQDISPCFNKEELNAIWANIKMPIDKSKQMSLRGSKGGAPKGNKNASKQAEKQAEIQPEKQAEIQPKKQAEKQAEKQTNNISIFLFLISNFNYLNNNELLKGKIKDWLEYKTEKKDKYTTIGLKTLLKKIEDNAIKYGDKTIIELIDDSMACNYSGIVFEKLKNCKPQSKNGDSKEWI